MNSNSLNKDIVDIRDDLSTLTAEIQILQEEKDLLDRQLEALNKELEAPSSSQVEIIKHVPFDSQISEFFDKKRKIDRAPSKITADLLELKENILYENIFRIGGTTAFPINDYTLNEEILGIRLDNFSNLNKLFVVPNYIILRKVESKAGPLEWEVYRHTLPVYIPLKEYDLTDLHKFVTDIRRHLILIQYKQDKIEQLKTLTAKQFRSTAEDKPVVTDITRDLECQRVTISIGSIQLELVCSLDHIEIVNFISDKNQETLLHCSNILRNSTFQLLLSHFYKILTILFNVNII